jgi:hypothetical protein
MASNISVSATLPLRRRQTSTKESRLAALTLAEQEERRALAAPYLSAVPKGHYLQPKSEAYMANQYLRYFHSSEGDAETAESLLPSLKDARGTSSSGQRWRDKHRAERNVMVSKKRASSRSSSGGSSPSSFNGHLDSDGDEDLAYSPKASPPQSVAAGTQHSRGAVKPLLENGAHAPPSASPYLDRARLRAIRPKNNSDKDVDLLNLNPASAEAYVKYEKLYRMMVAEDDEFFAFRRQYFKRLAGPSLGPPPPSRHKGPKART